jgi:hypothetical protein
MKGISWIKRTFVVASVVFAAALAVVAGAGATPPTREVLPVLDYEFPVDCSLYGFAFTLNVQGEATRWVETFYDAAGNPVRIVNHDTTNETNTNSVSGKTLRATARLVETLDLVAGTRTVVGQEFRMIDPGLGVVIQDMGRVVFDAPFHVWFEAGHHEALHGNLDQLACTALAVD